MKTITRETKIGEIDLGIRTIVALSDAGINTVGELMDYDVDLLLEHRNFGRKSWGKLLMFIEMFSMGIDKAVPYKNFDKKDPCELYAIVKEWKKNNIDNTKTCVPDYNSEKDNVVSIGGRLFLKCYTGVSDKESSFMVAFDSIETMSRSNIDGNTFLTLKGSKEFLFSGMDYNRLVDAINELTEEK